MSLPAMLVLAAVAIAAGAFISPIAGIFVIVVAVIGWAFLRLFTRMREREEEELEELASPPPAVAPRREETKRPNPEPKAESRPRAPERVVIEREKIIERQIVVTHCKYCKELTPVDLSACKACGATLT